MDTSPFPEVLSRNLAALHEVDPELADQLGSLNVDALHPTLAGTRDGQNNFRLTSPDGTLSWLGQTSIPMVRAQALIEQFDAGDSNVILPGIGEGTEARLLLSKLKPIQSVFIWERDVAMVRLALALHDYEADLRAQRLVLLISPLAELSAAVLDWLQRNPTQSCPSRMLRWPWQSHAEIADIRSAMEAAWNENQLRRATNNPH